MGTEFRAALRAVINDLTGVPARWLAAGLLGLDLALLLTIIVVDHKVDAHDLRVVGVGVIVLGALALTMAMLLGDGGRAMWLQFAGTGFRDPERRRQARKLSLRAAVFALMVVLLLLFGLPLVTAGGQGNA
jgi:hypothetical protein